MAKHMAAQRGAVLVVTLIIMLILTLLTVSTARSTLMQEKMTSSVNDAYLALESAELAIKHAEAKIETLTSTGTFTETGTNGLFAKGSAPSDMFHADTWKTEKTAAAGNASATGVTEARYFIEDIGLIDDADGSGDINVGGYGQHHGGGAVNAFRIVARSHGRSDQTERIVTSMYGKRL